MTILHIDSSARTDGSVTRELTRKIVTQLGGKVVTRDVSTGLPYLSEDWVAANFAPAPKRTAEQVQHLAGSDALVAELLDADTIVIGAPIYNFGVPAALKAWFDQIARVGVTFRYSDDGPKGLLTGKRAIIVVASGGTAADSDIDFATPYLRHMLGFIGITDITLIAADQMGAGGAEKLKAAATQIEALAA